MPPLRPKHLIPDDFDGSNIKLLRRERGDKAHHVRWSQLKDDVDVMRKARIAVNDRCNGAGDHVVQLLIVKPRGKYGEEIRLLDRSLLFVVLVVGA